MVMDKQAIIDRLYSIAAQLNEDLLDINLEFIRLTYPSNTNGEKDRISRTIQAQDAKYDKVEAELNSLIVKATS